MKPKVAIVTQSYKGDIKECLLLCESIDLFVGDDILHYIFVNDEDYELFKNSGLSNRHIIKKKSELLPKYWINVPIKLLGHKYYLSPLTIPVREWIIQQICKLAAFEILDKEIRAIINIDSETVFMRPFRIEDIYRASTDSFVFFREPFMEEPNHQEYCTVAKKLCRLDIPLKDIEQHCYMSHPTIFVRENIEELWKILSSGSKNWKNTLGNTYRFSEYYLYGIFTAYNLKFANHYLTSTHLFPLIDVGKLTSSTQLEGQIKNKMSNPEVLGVWLQKSYRNDSNNHYLPFNQLAETIRAYWKSVLKK